MATMKSVICFSNDIAAKATKRDPSQMTAGVRNEPIPLRSNAVRVGDKLYFGTKIETCENQIEIRANGVTIERKANSLICVRERAGVYAPVIMPIAVFTRATFETVEPQVHGEVIPVPRKAINPVFQGMFVGDLLDVLAGRCLECTDTKPVIGAAFKADGSGAATYEKDGAVYVSTRESRAPYFGNIVIKVGEAERLKPVEKYNVKIEGVDEALTPEMVDTIATLENVAV